MISISYASLIVAIMAQSASAYVSKTITKIKMLTGTSSFGPIPTVPNMDPAAVVSKIPASLGAPTQPGTAAAGNAALNSGKYDHKGFAAGASVECLPPSLNGGGGIYHVKGKGMDVKNTLGDSGIDLLALLRAKCGGDTAVTGWQFSQSGNDGYDWSSSFTVAPQAGNVMNDNSCVGDVVQTMLPSRSKC